MTPEQLKQLRAELSCSARELATTLGLELSELQAWENGERFPTKRNVDELESLRAKGPSAIQRKKSKRAPEGPTVIARLSDPVFWSVVRKLATHPELFAQVVALAQRFEEPAP